MKSINEKISTGHFFLPWRDLLSVLLFFSALLWRGPGAEIFAQVIQSFSYTGTAQTFIVPGCVDTIHVKAWGGGGSGGGSDSYIGAPGGGGGFVQSSIAVTAGQTLTVIVGGGGGPGGNCAGSAPGGTGGWGNGVHNGGRGGNAGSNGCSGGGGAGGGASSIYNGSTALLVAAGGGGGSGGGNTSAGGAGGGAGQNGNTGSGCSIGIAGGSGGGNGNQGGDRGSGNDGAGGGGGGGGNNGGTGGGAPPGCDCGGCGGGGGNNYSSGTGNIINNGSGQSAGNNTDNALPSGAAAGGYHSAGGNGFIQLIFNGAPVVAFSGTSVCNGDATQFTDNTTNVSGTIVSRAWDFGDGSPVNTSQNPPHTYANAGTYTVKLIENNSVGCADTLSKSIQVYYNPVTGFTHNDVCLGDSMHFINTSSVDPSTSIASYLWVFGDGGPTSTLKNPAHYYSTKGTYTVTLVSTTADGCSSAAIVTVKTFDTPTSIFTFSNTCLSNSALFTNASTPPTMGTLANWSWDFGDGSPLIISVSSPQHLFSLPGKYQVTLITHSSNLGCPDTLQDSITVYPMPVTRFLFANVCLHQPMNFNDSSIASSGIIATRSWNFGDATPLVTLQDPSHTYTSPGTYSVTLIVTTNHGCKDTIVKSVVVHPLPTAQFSRANVCDGTGVQFNGLSSVPSSDTIQSNTWNFGDGNSGITLSPLHLYSAAGSYTVKLVIISNFGCRDSISKISIVNPNPVVKFHAPDTVGCEPLCVNFKDTSTILTGVNAHWLWNVGDGSATHTTQAFIHCYINDSVFAANSFNVTLTVTSDSGCVTTKIKNNYITVYPNPVAGFSVQPESTTITDPVISFKNFSTGTTIWNWNLGDNTSSSIEHPMPHTYQDTGTYIVRLITSTQYSCADTAYKNVIIEPVFLFYIPNAFTPDGDGINDTFIGKGIFITEYKMSIYDRWGNLIFYTDDIHQPWDGKANHGTELAQRDVYVYVIEIVDFKKKKHNYRGAVTLMR